MPSCRTADTASTRIAGSVPSSTNATIAIGITIWRSGRHGSMPGKTTASISYTMSVTVYGR